MVAAGKTNCLRLFGRSAHIRHGPPDHDRGFLKRGAALESTHQRRTALLDRFVSIPAPNPVEKPTPDSPGNRPANTGRHRQCPLLAIAATGDSVFLDMPLGADNTDLLPGQLLQALSKSF